MNPLLLALQKVHVYRLQYQLSQRQLQKQANTNADNTMLQPENAKLDWCLGA